MQQQYFVTILNCHDEVATIVVDASTEAEAYTVVGEDFPDLGLVVSAVEADKWGTRWCHHRQTWVDPIGGWRNANREDLQAFLRESDAAIAAAEDFSRLV